MQTTDGLPHGTVTRPQPITNTTWFSKLTPKTTVGSIGFSGVCLVAAWAYIHIRIGAVSNGLDVLNESAILYPLGSVLMAACVSFWGGHPLKAKIATFGLLVFIMSSIRFELGFAPMPGQQTPLNSAVANSNAAASEAQLVAEMDAAIKGIGLDINSLNAVLEPDAVLSSDITASNIEKTRAHIQKLGRYKSEVLHSLKVYEEHLKGTASQGAASNATATLRKIVTETEEIILIEVERGELTLELLEWLQRVRGQFTFDGKLFRFRSAEHTGYFNQRWERLLALDRNLAAAVQRIRERQVRK